MDGRNASIEGFNVERGSRPRTDTLKGFFSRFYVKERGKAGLIVG